MAEEEIGRVLAFCLVPALGSAEGVLIISGMLTIRKALFPSVWSFELMHTLRFLSLAKRMPCLFSKDTDMRPTEA
jgi:hypothetical protein